MLMVTRMNTSSPTPQFSGTVFGDFLYDPVTRPVAVGIVVLFEIINIQHKEARLVIVPLESGITGSEAGHEKSAVVCSRQLIMIDKDFNLLLQLHFFSDIPYIPHNKRLR